MFNTGLYHFYYLTAFCLYINNKRYYIVDVFIPKKIVA